MAINSLETAVKYSAELDKLFAQKSATGFFADNDFGKKFVGAKTVIIPNINFQGLADYDRDNGYSRGAITVSNTSYTMKMDRARSLQIDREDMDETGIASLAGKILGEYVRTKVVPECDAYVLSKLAGVAISRGNTMKFDNEKPFETLTNLITEVRKNVGYDEELVAFVNGGVYAALQNSPEINRMIISSDFKQGDINLTVKSINGVALIPVVGERMKTAYNFSNSGEGGFTPLDTAKEIYMLVCPKKAAHLVKKTENMRVFTPEQNLDADAYKFDYRIYYDVFVKNSDLDSIWTCLSSSLSVELVSTDIMGQRGVPYDLEVRVTSDSEDVAVQWYIATDEALTTAVKIPGATTAKYTFEGFEELGNFYFYAKVTVDGIHSVNSDILKAEVYE